MIAPVPVAELHVLSLGDSYTIGEGVPAADAWPVQLAALLRSRGMAVAAPTIIARTGWTTAELSSGIDAANPSPPYDLVTLLVGVNDQFRGHGLRDFRDRFRELLQRVVGFANGRASRVIVLSIPDWGVTPFADGRDRGRIARDIDAFNSVSREESSRAGARYVDITGESRRASGEPEMLVADGLHPSGRMYAEWARLTLPGAVAALT